MDGWCCIVCAKTGTAFRRDVSTSPTGSSVAASPKVVRARKCGLSVNLNFRPASDGLRQQLADFGERMREKTGPVNSCTDRVEARTGSHEFRTFALPHALACDYSNDQ
jgi:hypothetical protein